MFRIGQKVVCVDDCGAFSALSEGTIYTITKIIPGRHWIRTGEPSTGLLLREVDWYEPGFAHARFRPIVERKTDISIFEEILRRESVPDECAPAAVYGVDWGASA